MPVEVIGVDHVFVAVRDVEAAMAFYDRVMAILCFRKGEGALGGAPHVFYYGRRMVYALRPVDAGTPDHALLRGGG